MRSQTTTISKQTFCEWWFKRNLYVFLYNIQRTFGQNYLRRRQKKRRRRRRRKKTVVNRTQTRTKKGTHTLAYAHPIYWHEHTHTDIVWLAAYFKPQTAASLSALYKTLLKGVGISRFSVKYVIFRISTFFFSIRFVFLECFGRFDGRWRGGRWGGGQCFRTFYMSENSVC